MQQIDLKDAQQHLPEMVERAAGGEEVIIFRDNEPLVKLVAVANTRSKREFGSARGLIEMADDFDESLEDFREYM